MGQRRHRQRPGKLPPLGGKIDSLMAAFHRADKDKNGVITREELAEDLRSQGALSDVNLDELMMVFDTDQDGKLCYMEFVEVGKVMKCFREADNDGSGEIMRTELIEVLRAINPSFAVRDLEALVSEIDF